jgi:hypothetical protein
MNRTALNTSALRIIGHVQIPDIASLTKNFVTAKVIVQEARMKKHAPTICAQVSAVKQAVVLHQVAASVPVPKAINSMIS